jgi:hypothetical protein
VVNRIKRLSLEPADRSSDPLERLERLATLHREGSLTDEEFAAMKQRLINDDWGDATTY